VAALLVAASLSCTGAPGADPGAPPATEGELVVHVVDFGERTETIYGLRLDGGAIRTLTLPAPTSLSSGSRVRVRGSDDGRTIRATALTPISQGPVGAETRALVAGTRKRERTWAFVLVDTGGGVNTTKAEVEKILFGADRLSIRGYYEEVSYGLQTIKGEVFGPFKVQVEGALALVRTAAGRTVRGGGGQRRVKR
jgi:hypothetical protein